MARHHFYSYVQNTDGIRIGNASICIYKANTATPATVYDDEVNGSVFDTVPQVNSNSSGYFEFWIDDSIYNQYQEFKLEAKSSGYNATIDYVAVTRTSDGWKKITATYASRAGDKLFVDTTGGAFSIDMPASPASGDVLQIADCAGTFATNSPVMKRNGSNMRSVATDLTVDINWVKIQFEFVDATRGWRY